MNGLEFPLKLTDIGKFEAQNASISVSVFDLDENEDIFPLRITNSMKENHIRLLLISNETNHH